MADELKAPTTGTPAPAFSLPARSGKTISLADSRGKRNVLVYFYPKDDTPGCTKEACSLRDAWAALKAADIEVLGISQDGADSHNAFASKFNLPFELLTDENHAVHEAYGAWGLSKWGTGALRKSFLIGKDGTIRHIFHKVDTEHHAEEVLKAMETPKPTGPYNSPAPKPEPHPAPAAPAVSTPAPPKPLIPPAPKPAAPPAPAPAAPQPTAPKPAAPQPAAPQPAAPQPTAPKPAAPQPAAPKPPAPKPPAPPAAAPPKPAAPAPAKKKAAKKATKKAPAKKKSAAKPKKKATKKATKKAAPKKKATKKATRKATKKRAPKKKKK
jgi:thioredoxin-dependent peroxiredoxin